MNCKKCGNELIGIEYPYGHPDRYDGVSEWKCLVCGYRVGRFSHRELQPGETEKRYSISKEAS